MESREEVTASLSSSSSMEFSLLIGNTGETDEIEEISADGTEPEHPLRRFPQPFHDFVEGVSSFTRRRKAIKTYAWNTNVGFF